MDQFLFVKGYAAEFIIKKKGDPTDQEYLTTLIDVETEKKMLLSALMLVEAKNVISKKEILIQLLSHKVPNIRIKSLGKLVAMLGTEGTPIYVKDALANPKFREKDNAVYHLKEHGDERAIPAMVKRLRNILNTRKSTPHLMNQQESELTHIVVFLNKFEDSSIEKVFKRVKEKWNILVTEEQQLLVDNVLYFSEQNIKSS